MDIVWRCSRVEGHSNNSHFFEIREINKKAISKGFSEIAFLLKYINYVRVFIILCKLIDKSSKSSILLILFTQKFLYSQLCKVLNYTVFFLKYS